MRKKENWKQKHQKKQSRLWRKGRVNVFLVSIAVIIIIGILMVGFLAKQYQLSSANEPKTSSSQALPLNKNPDMDKKTDIVYQDIKGISVNCFRSQYDYDTQVIRSKLEYDDLFSRFNNNDTCPKSVHPEINFRKHVLMLDELRYGCDTVVSRNKNVYLDEKNKKIVYEVTYEEVECNLQPLYFESLAVLLPNLPGYTVDFKFTKIPRSDGNELR